MIFCSFIVQQRTENGRLETVNVPARNCYYTGSVVDHQFSRVAVSVCNDEMVNSYMLAPHVHVLNRAIF